ncbi:NXPE family member 3-like isoform X1 [Pecten maximus]|uniref:NXPE family member 3-like isoform X1 n=2 Tax=Pecten maximus TaxID=6579 RepID=UPI001458CDEA|nr:NXPE family member 3-like isoform X1 [Pecten maximus]
MFLLFRYQVSLLDLFVYLHTIEDNHIHNKRLSTRRTFYSDGAIMFKPLLTKLFLAVAIMGTLFVTSEWLNVIPVHVMFRIQQFPTVNDVIRRQNVSLTSSKGYIKETRAGTVHSFKDEIVQYKSKIVMKTILKSPMAAISRNILDRYLEYRQIQRVQSFKELYDPRFSVVEIDRKSGSLIAGSKLTIRISLYNGFNQSLTQGGDLLNIWLRNAEGTSTVAGHVVDHMNGNYTGHVMAFWAGNVILKLTVTNTKEGIGLYTNYVHERGAYQFIKATFSNGNKTEMTLCAASKTNWLEKRYGGLCNLTKENYNLSFFCGKPRSLSCTSWLKYSYDSALHFDLNSSQILGYKDRLLKQIKLTIVPSDNGDLDYPMPKTPCKDLPPALTWNSTVPSGFPPQRKVSQPYMSTNSRSQF